MPIIYPTMSEREISGAAIARRAATQGMVLLKNENEVLPLKVGKIALFGNGAIRTVRGGTGSGDPFNGGLSGGGDENVDFSPRYHIQISDAFQAEGFEILNMEQLLAYGEKYDAGKATIENRVMQAYAFPEEVLEEDALAALSKETDTAVFVISRNAGEGNDRTLTTELTFDEITYEIGDYRLSQTEKDNLKKVCHAFEKVVVVLNVGGAIATDDFTGAGADAILLMSQAGQEGGAALLDILTGRVNPSGKMAATWAKKYKDYPSSEVFLKDPKTALYEEGIYVGYRYFDTFDVEPGFAFGYGLSYTTFAVSDEKAVLKGDVLEVSAVVTNTGKVSGREVVQVYVSSPVSVLDMPEHELKGFAKTKDLAPGEKEELKIRIPLSSLASFSEEQVCYLLSAGMYRVSAGTSSRDVKPVCRVEIKETTPVELVYIELPLKQELKEMTGLKERKDDEIWNTVPVLVPEKLPELLDSRSIYQDESVTTYTMDPEYKPVKAYEKVQLVEKKESTLQDVMAGRVSLEEFTAQFTAAQLSDFCCGTGWGVADDNNPVIGASSESVPGAAGETTHQLEKYGVESMVLADGPGGIRITQVFEATELETGKKKTVYHYCTAWPVGTLLAQSFDVDVLEEVGRGMAADMDDMNIALVLGPGINIQRDPMCGRNFEYFSEDPFLTGKLAAAITKGIQSVQGAGACIKHYAANNQETNRATIDSVIGQRALREIYLEPYKIAIRESQPLSIMTSYNLLNGVPTADSFDLCTNFARGECGFEGLIMTDWNGGSSTPWKSMHAGNDLLMPGGELRAMNIQQAVEIVDPKFDECGQIDMSPEMPFMPVGDARWNSFQLDADGNDTITAPIAEGHKAEVKDGMIYVDGKLLYTKAQDRLVLRAAKNKGVPLYLDPVTTEIATLSEDGTSITYHGSWTHEQKICLGDIQRCAMNNFRVIMKTRK